MENKAHAALVPIVGNETHLVSVRHVLATVKYNLGLCSDERERWTERGWLGGGSSRDRVRDISFQLLLLQSGPEYVRHAHSSDEKEKINIYLTYSRKSSSSPTYISSLCQVPHPFNSFLFYPIYPGQRVGQGEPPGPPNLD